LLLKARILNEVGKTNKTKVANQESIFSWLQTDWLQRLMSVATQQLHRGGSSLYLSFTTATTVCTRLLWLRQLIFTFSHILQQLFV